MKKLVALAMAGILTFSCAPAAYASEETETIVLDTTMMEEGAYEGSWVSAFDVFDLYLPNDWVITCNGDEGEKVNENTVFAAQSEDGSRCVGIEFVMTDYTDLAAIYEDYEQQAEILATRYITVNDIPAVSYLIGEEETTTNGFSMLTDDGGLYSVYLIGAQDDEEFKVIGSNIGCSVSVHAAESETEAAE